MGLAEALGAVGIGVGCGRGGGKPNRPDEGGVRDRFSGFPLRALVVARLQCGGCGDQRWRGMVGAKLDRGQITGIEEGLTEVIRGEDLGTTALTKLKLNQES